MKIGVISDTHIPVVTDKIPEDVLKQFDGVDLILHAGDLVSLDVLDELNKIAKTVAVYGNMDYSASRYSLSDKTVVKAGKFRIGLIHGGGAPWDIADRIRRQFDKVNAIVFGHTHQPMNEWIDGILFFNPGTPTDLRFSHKKTVGIIEVGADLKGRIVEL